MISYNNSLTLSVISFVALCIQPLEVVALGECPNGEYYIGANGNNSFNGCSPQTPWKNFDRISQQLGANTWPEVTDYKIQLQPGNKILLQKGAVWEGQHLIINDPGITLSNYTQDALITALPILRGAANLSSEPFYNGDMDITTTTSNPLRDRFMGWASGAGSAANNNSVTAINDPRGLPGYSARMQYYGGAGPQLLGGAGFTVGANLPMQLSFQAQVDSGELNVYIKNTVTSEYLDSANNWSSTFIAARSLTAANYAQMDRVQIDYTSSNTKAVYSVFFRPGRGADSFGDVYVDDVVITSDWIEHTPGIYKRASLARQNNVKTIYDPQNGGLPYNQKIGLANLTTKGDWFFELTRSNVLTYCRSDLDYFDIRVPVNGSCTTGYTLYSAQELDAYCITDPQATSPAPYNWRTPRITNDIYECDSGYTWFGKINDTYTLYIHWPDGLASLQQTDLKIHRTNATLIDLQADNLVVDGLALENAFEGIRVRNSNARVSNNVISNIETRGIYAYAISANIYALTIASNAVTDAGGGIYLQDSHDSVASGNTVRNIRNRGSITDHEAMALQSGINVLFLNNIVDGAASGIALWGSKTKPANFNTVAYNRVHDVDGGGIVLAGGSFWVDAAETIRRVSVAGNKIHYNIVTGSGFGDETRGAGIRQNWTPWLEPNYYYNNTLSGNRYNFMGDSCFSGNFVFKNNISHSPERKHLFFNYVDTDNVWYPECLKRNDIDASVLTHNLYYPDGSAGTGIYNWKGVEYDTFAEYQNGSGMDSVNSLGADPIFFSASEFNLLATSPAIDAGTDVGLTTDFPGSSILGSADFGAYEFGHNDSDNDNVTDYDEVCFDGDCQNYDPYDPVTNPSGSDLNVNIPDSDGDGSNDGEEIAAGTDPLDNSSNPVIRAPAMELLALIFLMLGLVTIGLRFRLNKQ